MNYLAPAVAFLSGRVVGVTVSGPRDDLPIAPAPLPPTCIVQAVPGTPLAGGIVKTVTYTLRLYGMTTDAVLAAYEAVAAAFVTELGDPVGPLAVGDSWWLYGAAIGTPGGPEPDPVARWPVLIATAVMHWPTSAQA